MDDDLCDGCGADLNETDGNTFDMDMGDGSTIQLCPDCEARQDDEPDVDLEPPVHPVWG